MSQTVGSMREEACYKKTQQCVHTSVQAADSMRGGILEGPQQYVHFLVRSAWSSILQPDAVRDSPEP